MGVHLWVMSFQNTMAWPSQRTSIVLLLVACLWWEVHATIVPVVAAAATTAQQLPQGTAAAIWCRSTRRPVQLDGRQRRRVVAAGATQPMRIKATTL